MLDIFYGRSQAQCCNFYQPEGFKSGKALNGRRMAGASFLKGFFANADVDVSCAVVDTSNKLKDFVDQAHQYSYKKPVRDILNDRIEELLPVSSVFISTPNYHSWAWQRLNFGMETYSLCRLTHTLYIQYCSIRGCSQFTCKSIGRIGRHYLHIKSRSGVNEIFT